MTEKTFRPEENFSKNNQLHSSCIQQFNELKRQNDLLKSENASLNKIVDRRNDEITDLITRNGQEEEFNRNEFESNLKLTF